MSLLNAQRAGKTPLLAFENYSENEYFKEKLRDIAFKDVLTTKGHFRSSLVISYRNKKRAKERRLDTKSC